MSISKLLYLFFMFQAMSVGAVSNDSITEPYAAHAHNDYMHERPLFDALDNGFRSIEADVFAIGDSLYVAHNRRDIQAGRTFRKLYLEPLMQCISKDGPGIYDSASPLILLIDIKDDGLTGYKLLDRILDESRDLLCQVSRGVYVPGYVMVIVSGNRPINYMMQQEQRFAFVDGRMENLTESYPPTLMPLISDRWPKYFTWRGKGDMPDKERMQLRSNVQEAHERGQLIRYWATPDVEGEEREAVWTELVEAGVDLINTDDLEGLRTFLRARGD